MSNLASPAAETGTGAAASDPIGQFKKPRKPLPKKPIVSKSRSRNKFSAISSQLSQENAEKPKNTHQARFQSSDDIITLNKSGNVIVSTISKDGRNMEPSKQNLLFASTSSQLNTNTSSESPESLINLQGLRFDPIRVSFQFLHKTFNPSELVTAPSPFILVYIPSSKLIQQKSTSLKRKPFTVYIIKVLTDLGWYHIERRYSEFHKLFTTLKKQYRDFPFPPFPPKRAPGRSLQSKEVGIRCTMLSNFLKTIILHPQISQSPCVIKFLFDAKNQSLVTNESSRPQNLSPIIQSVAEEGEKEDAVVSDEDRESTSSPLQSPASSNVGALFQI